MIALPPSTKTSLSGCLPRARFEGAIVREPRTEDEGVQFKQRKIGKKDCIHLRRAREQKDDWHPVESQRLRKGQ